VTLKIHVAGSVSSHPIWSLSPRSTEWHATSDAQWYAYANETLMISTTKERSISQPHAR